VVVGGSLNKTEGLPLVRRRDLSTVLPRFGRLLLRPGGVLRLALLGIPWSSWQGRNCLSRDGYYVQLLWGILQMTCEQEHSRGFPFYALWMASTLVTNLMLQRILLIKATELPRYLRIVFQTEVVAVLAMCCWMAAVVIYMQYLSTSLSVSLSQMPKDDVFVISMVSITICSYAVFVIIDCVFSYFAAKAMHAGLQRVRRLMLVSPVRLCDTGESLRTGDGHARALAFTKINLALVILSVSTTSMYYFAAAMVLVSTFNVGIAEQQHALLNFLWLAWLLDSLFNNLCVVFVGFGPTEEVLTAVGRIAEATAGAAAPLLIGMPTRQSI